MTGMTTVLQMVKETDCYLQKENPKSSDQAAGSPCLFGTGPT